MDSQTPGGVILTLGSWQSGPTLIPRL